MAIPIKTKLNIELTFIIFLCIVAFLVGPLSFIPQIRPYSESTASWFQRSGAITSIFCVFAQYRISNFLESIRGGTFAESWEFFYFFRNRQYAISWAITLVSIWGALVWGYGDLLIKCFMR